MAEDMTRLLSLPPLLTLLALALSMIAPASRAQAVQDPTRPPVQLNTPAGASAGAAGSAPQLQSILVARAPGGRRVAVIDGNMVRIGDLVQGARVVAITGSGVQLQRGGKRETLKLMAPEVAFPAPAPIAAAANPALPPAGKRE